jgi:hypothetical protein
MSIDLTSTVVDPTQGALHVSQRPQELTGEYTASLVSGALTVIAAGTATTGHLAALRWAQATPCLIHSVDIEFLVTTGFTAAQALGFSLFKLTGYSVAHTAGTATVLGTTGKKRTTQANSLVSDLRIAAAVALTAGTHTLDTAPVGQARFFTGAATAGTRLQQRLLMTDPLGYPLVLGANEGLLIRNEILMGAGGVGTLTATINWREAASY